MPSGGPTTSLRVCSGCQSWGTFQEQHECPTGPEAALNFNQVPIHAHHSTRGCVRMSPCLHQARTVFVHGEGDVRGDDLVVADLAELEGAVGVHGLHLQDAVIRLPLEDGGFVGLLLEGWRVLVDVVDLDVHSGPDGGTYSVHTMNADGLTKARGFRFKNGRLSQFSSPTRSFFSLQLADSLVRLLHVGPIRTLSTVVCLDGERVLLLQLTVHLVLCPDDSLSGGLVQDHGLEGDILPVDPEATDLT